MKITHLSSKAASTFTILIALTAISLISAICPAVTSKTTTQSSASVFLKGGIQAFEPNSWRGLTDPVLNLELKGDAISMADYIPDIKGNLYLDAHLEGPVSRLQGKGLPMGITWT